MQRDQIIRAARLALAALLLLVILFYLVIIAASESGEVITLTTTAEDGRPVDTRIWVVDYEGAEWVRTGNPSHGWFQRMLANPEVSLTRAGHTSRRCAVVVRDAQLAGAVMREFAAKYGSADWIVALSGDAARRVPVLLEQRGDGWHPCSLVTRPPDS